MSLWSSTKAPVSSETSSKRVDAFMIVTCLLASCPAWAHRGRMMHFRLFYFSSPERYASCLNFVSSDSVDALWVCQSL